MTASSSGGAHRYRRSRRYKTRDVTKRRARRGSSRRSIPANQGRSSADVMSGPLTTSLCGNPARTSTVRVPAPVSQRRSTPSHTRTPRDAKASTSSRSSVPGAMRTMTWESARAAKAANASPRAGCRPNAPEPVSSPPPGAAMRPHTTTVPGPCQSPSRRAMSRHAADELAVGSAGSSRSPITSTLRPSGTSTQRPPSVVGVVRAPFPVGSASVMRSHRVTSAGRPPPGPNGLAL